MIRQLKPGAVLFILGIQRAAGAVQQARVRPAHAQRLHEELARGADLAQREGGQGARQGLGRPQPQRPGGTFMPGILSANMVLLIGGTMNVLC